MPETSHALLFQINTRVYLGELSAALGRRATFDDVPDAALDAWRLQGFEWLWFLGVWQTGEAGRRVSLSKPEWLAEYRQTLHDFTEADVCGSCFAIQAYLVHRDFGGDAALARLRQRMAERGLRLMVDFVPNHTALDHAWVSEHPEFYIHGTEDDLALRPHNYTRVDTPQGSLILAYGRDPYFDGWPDTLQLDYASAEYQAAMRGELAKIAERADGVRCDMAMLALGDVFERTWGRRAPDFWPAAIGEVRARHPAFAFMAEVYWDLEWTLQQQGFDYTYDKRLYDRLREGSAAAIRAHLSAGIDYQRRLARFLENHDEPRAAAAFSPDMHRAAAVAAYLAPGMRFFHEGQFEGRQTRVSVHLARRPSEPVDHAIRDFYDRLLGVVQLPQLGLGDWRLLECVPAWEGNGTNDAFLAYLWRRFGESDILVAVNYTPHQSQCYVRPPARDLGGAMMVRLVDLLGSAVYDRACDDLATRGLYLDMPAWGYHAFRVE